MNEGTRYIQEVLHNIQLPPRERARIEADLRAHFAEALAAGEPPAEVIRRLGSPAQVAEEFMAGVKLHYARFWPRLAAFAVDVAIIAAVALLLVALAMLLSSVEFPAGTQMVLPSTGGWSYVGRAILIIGVISSVLLAIGISMLYFPVQEGRFGQTVGKRLLGLRVVKENGLAIGFKEAFLRRVPFYFRFLVVDTLFVFFTAKRQRAFDIIARTVVIRE